MAQIGYRDGLRICRVCDETHDAAPDGINVETHPTAKLLTDRSNEFLREVRHLTPGPELEARLNSEYGPGNAYYEDFCRLVKQGLAEGWLASGEVKGEKYRRGRISSPSPTNLSTSLTAVYFDTTGATGSSTATFSGQYHQHPNGEINCVVPIDPTFELEGLPVGENWKGQGWTSPGPGSQHFPRARGGRGVAFFFLPEGAIRYDVKPREGERTE